MVGKKAKTLSEYFKNPIYDREFAIYSAILDGYTQVEIAKYLNVSNTTISKILKVYKQKISLFIKLKEKGIFWSYSKDVKYDITKKDLTIEYLLKYGDFDDIILGFKLFGKRAIKKSLGR